MSTTVQIASRYAGTTGPPKIYVFERICSSLRNGLGQPMNPPAHENAFESEPTTNALS